MVKYTLKRMLREPLPRLAVVLFAGIMALLLCVMKISMERERESREFIYDTVPVPVYITNLSGTRRDNLGISSSAIYAFQNGLMSNYISDVALEIRTSASWMMIGEEMLPPVELAGITSLHAAQELAANPDGSIDWLEDYDQSMLRESKPICILPRSLMPADDEIQETVLFHFETTVYNAERKCNEIIKIDVECTIAGYHVNENRIYCPASVVESIVRRLDMPVEYDSASGILIDNRQMEKLRQASSKWFTEPELTSAVTDEVYSFALKIDDSQLRAADKAMAQSETTNRFCTAIVFVLTAVAGFLIGFLMVRSHKKEIALMRTMGTPNQSVYFAFVLEQMLCVVLGIVLGGAYNQWQPLDRLVILAVIYFVGLTVALLIFLRKNLLTTIKEDE